MDTPPEQAAGIRHDCRGAGARPSARHLDRHRGPSVRRAEPENDRQRSALNPCGQQNRLIAFVARYVSVTTSETSRLGFSAKRTLILPGDVRYELDLAKLQSEDVDLGCFDEHASACSSRKSSLPVPMSILLPRAGIWRGRRSVGADRCRTRSSIRTNRAKAVSDLRKQASGAVPMRLAHQAARAAIERSFAMPLLAAGFDGREGRCPLSDGGHRRRFLSRPLDPI